MFRRVRGWLNPQIRTTKAEAKAKDAAFGSSYIG